MLKIKRITKELKSKDGSVSSSNSTNSDFERVVYSILEDLIQMPLTDGDIRTITIEVEE